MRKTCLSIFIMAILCTGASAHQHRRAHSTRHCAAHSAHVPDVGIATWYGRGDFKNKNGFHHFTSDGEKFNPRAMTCAHLTMPFNTVVKVVEVSTGKFIYVRVNDRMVARPPHIIDLTLAAAEALGIAHKGKTVVRLEPVEVAEAPK